MLKFLLEDFSHLAPDYYVEASKKLPLAEQEYIANCNSIKRKQEFCLSRLQLRKQLLDFGLDFDAEIIITEPFKKPILKNFSNIHFSISHHKGMHAVLISDFCKVGMDLQFLENKNNLEQIAERYFHDFELAYLQQCKQKSDSLFIESFYRLWTLKESYTKINENLLLQNLKYMKIDLVNTKIDFENSSLDNCFFYEIVSNIENFKIAFCSSEKLNQEQLKQISLSVNFLEFK